MLREQIARIVPQKCMGCDVKGCHCAIPCPVQYEIADSILALLSEGGELLTNEELRNEIASFVCGLMHHGDHTKACESAYTQADVILSKCNIRMAIAAEKLLKIFEDHITVSGQDERSMVEFSMSKKEFEALKAKWGIK